MTKWKSVCSIALVLLTPLLAIDLEKIQNIAVSSASADFTGSDAYTAASKWNDERLIRGEAEGIRAPYVACADYSQGRGALASLESAFGRSTIHRVSNSKSDGACFIVTASPSAATAMLSAPETFNLLSAGSFLPSLKLATGLLDHGSHVSDRSERLRTSYGEAASLDNVGGLNVRLSPGVLPMADESLAGGFVRDWHGHIMQTVSIKSLSFWSDPTSDRTTQDKIRVKEWSRAATVVDNLASKHSRPVGEICKLGELKMRHVGDDLLLLEGKKRARTP